MGTWLLFQDITTPELSLVEEKRGRELSGLKQSSCKDEGKATGYLLQDEILFGGSRLCHCEVTQKSLHLHQVGQLVNEDICQECTELWPWREREERSGQGSHSWGSSKARAGIWGALAERPMGISRGARTNTSFAAAATVTDLLLSHHRLLGAHSEDGDRYLEVPSAGKGPGPACCRVPP